MRMQSVEMALGTDLGVVERRPQLVIGNFHAATAMRPPRRQQDGLVGPELRRRADMTMAIDNHVWSSHVFSQFDVGFVYSFRPVRAPHVAWRSYLVTVSNS